MLDKEFDRWQEDYNAKITRWVPHYEQLINQLAELPNTFQPQEIMDLGCGNGNALALLLPIYSDAHYHLVDSSPEMIEAIRLRFKGQSNLSLMEKYFQDLNLLPNSLNLVVACLAIHHLKAEEKQQLFKSIYSWLQPGAYFVYSDIFGDKKDEDYQELVLSPWEAYAKSQGTPDEEWETLMEHHATFDFPDHLDTQINWLKRAGFETVTSKMNDRNFGTLQAFKGR